MPLDMKDTPNHAGLLRRLAAMFYDTLIVLALLIMGTLLAMLINHGQAINSQNHYYAIYLVTIIFSYFAISWIRGGQTIGMRAWKIQLTTINKEPMDLWRSFLRFGLAVPSILLCGLGFVWMFSNKRRLTYHDQYSGTRLIHLTRHNKNPAITAKNNVGTAEANEGDTLNTILTGPKN